MVPMSMRVAARTAALMVATAAAVLAGPLEDANEALIQKDYAKAVQLYRPLAAAGNPEAQVNLGYMYDEGLGVSRDYGEAVRWYRFAADQGEPQGLSNLANMYRDGVGVQQDYVQAHLWFNLAAGRFATEREARRRCEGPRQCRRENDRPNRSLRRSGWRRFGNQSLVPHPVGGTD